MALGDVSKALPTKATFPVCDRLSRWRSCVNEPSKWKISCGFKKKKHNAANKSSKKNSSSGLQTSWRPGVLVAPCLRAPAAARHSLCTLCFLC